MQRHHNPIASTNFDQEGLLGSKFPVYIHECPHNRRRRSAQHEHIYSNDDADMECISDMWENWLKTTSELQTLSNEVFDVSSSSSACMSTLPSNFSSQTSANSLQNSNTSTSEAINTSFIQSSPLSSDTNEHNLNSFCENSNVNELPDTSMDILSKSPNFCFPVETNLAAILSQPPLSLEIRAAGHQPPLYLKARASPHKMKTPGAIRNHTNNRTKENEEAITFPVESITTTIDESGYVWHKYGQKNIKNRTHPRGYFKCAQPHCFVKKQTERSSDIQGFLSIAYFGKHNHTSPQKTTLSQA